MKNKDLKKGKESIIGKIIYGFLLFMPLIAIFSTILINTFNMSAKQETEITYKYETNAVNSYQDLVEGNIYKVDLSNDYIYSGDGNCASIYIFDVTDDDDEPYPSIIIEDNGYIDFSFRNQSNKKKVSYDLAGYGGNSFILTPNSKVYVVFTDLEFQSQEIAEALIESDYSPIDTIETHNLNTREVFYNSIERVEDSELFNWAENTLIYTGLNNTCNQLGITTTFIPLLLAYWLIISVIYILYDIILMILIILHNKIHQIQDAI